MVHHQFDSLNDTSVYPSQGLVFANPRRPSTRCESSLQRIFGTSLDILVANEVIISGQHFARKDVAVAVVDNEMCVVEIWLHLKVGDDYMSLVSPWSRIDKSTFKVDDSTPVMIDPSSFIETCVYKFTSDGKSALVVASK